MSKGKKDKERKYVNTQAKIIHFAIISWICPSLTGEHIRMPEMCSVLHDERHRLSIHPVHPFIHLSGLSMCLPSPSTVIWSAVQSY